MSNEYSISMSEYFRKRSLGHPEIWECTLQEMIAKVQPVFLEIQKTHNLPHKVVKFACGYMRYKFDNKELKGTIAYEVDSAIDYSLVYFTNVLGEDV